jgi:hypothetical protein
MESRVGFKILTQPSTSHEEIKKTQRRVEQKRRCAQGRKMISDARNERNSGIGQMAMKMKVEVKAPKSSESAIRSPAEEEPPNGRARTVGQCEEGNNRQRDQRVESGKEGWKWSAKGRGNSKGGNSRRMGGGIRIGTMVR